MAAHQKIETRELARLYSMAELREMRTECNQKHADASQQYHGGFAGGIGGRKGRQRRPQGNDFYERQLQRDDFWNDPRHKMCGYQDHEDLMKDLKKDHIRLNKEVADLFKVACNTQLDKEHDKNKPPVMPYVAAQ